MTNSPRNKTALFSERWQQAVRALSDEQLAGAAQGLLRALAAQDGELPESRARALLLAAGVLDEPTLRDFAALTADPQAVRLALFDLVTGAGLPAETFEPALRLPGPPSPAVPWPALAVHAYAWKLSYPAAELDPGAPPTPYSPAGQTVHQAGQWVRRQTQRSATERERQGRPLAWSGPAASAPTLSPTAPTAPPLRPAIPVRHFEYNDPIAVDPNRPTPPPTPRGEPLSISPDELPAETAPPRTPPLVVEPEPEVRIIGESRRVPRPPQTGSRMPTVSGDDVRRVANRAKQSADRLVGAIRSSFSGEEMGTTRLRVLVQQYPDGPGVPAVQVRVRYQKSKSEIAGPTDSSGVFSCVVPVRLNAGLTYNVYVEWPSQLGARREMKAITVNADRTEFVLPFYARLA